ncbi:MAG: hypothetical protein N3F10_07410 [Candidatus Bathyarchaeota archaeon]|nr:hypothetical protein [Candidatus Bathyarchaeota archaeon]
MRGYDKGGRVDAAIIMEAVGSQRFLQLETIFGVKEKKAKNKRNPM